MRQKFKRILVSVLMGSKSDWETMQYCSQTLKSLGIPHQCRALSAHRTPAKLAEYVKKSERAGVRVFIAALCGDTVRGSGLIARILSLSTG